MSTGVDEVTIVNILTNRSNEQRQDIAFAYQRRTKKVRTGWGGGGHSLLNFFLILFLQPLLFLFLNSGLYQQEPSGTLGGPRFPSHILVRVTTCIHVALECLEPLHKDHALLQPRVCGGSRSGNRKLERNRE